MRLGSNIFLCFSFYRDRGDREREMDLEIGRHDHDPHYVDERDNEGDSKKLRVSLAFHNFPFSQVLLYYGRRRKFNYVLHYFVHLITIIPV